MSQRQAVLRPGSNVVPALSADVPQCLPLRLRPVLLELLSGVPDTTASRRLSMSPRTYSRRVAELLDYLGVATRFQAGAEIVRRGWVPGLAIGPREHVPGCQPELRPSPVAKAGLPRQSAHLALRPVLGRNSALIDIADRCAAGSVPAIADDVR